MDDIAQINMDDYFKPGMGSLVERIKDINTLLLQLTVIVNALVGKVVEIEAEVTSLKKRGE